jgi:hypothetical protein
MLSEPRRRGTSPGRHVPVTSNTTSTNAPTTSTSSGASKRSWIIGALFVLILIGCVNVLIYLPKEAIEPQKPLLPVKVVGDQRIFGGVEPIVSVPTIMAGTDANKDAIKQIAATKNRFTVHIATDKVCYFLSPST